MQGLPPRTIRHRAKIGSRISGASDQSAKAQRKRPHQSRASLGGASRASKSIGLRAKPNANSREETHLVRKTLRGSGLNHCDK